jgi:methylated-DNA-[protein]-cysteine S-methyltransferase
MLRSMELHRAFATAYGYAAIAWNDRGVSRLRLPNQTPEEAERALLRRSPRAKPATPSHEVARVINDVVRYFRGERVDFTWVQLDLREPDMFDARVYSLIREIAWGETTSYGAIARRLGAGPERARDVGRAMARNPIPLILPCHRVLGAGGRIGGFSAPGGTDLKAKMLALEGVVVAGVEHATVPAQKAFAF